MTETNALQASIGRLIDILNQLTASSITPAEAGQRTRAEAKLRRAIMREIKPRRRH